jgi:hypothetical protein
VNSVDGCSGLHRWENILFFHASGVNSSGAGPSGRLESDGTKTSEQCDPCDVAARSKSPTFPAQRLGAHRRIWFIVVAVKDGGPSPELTC